MLETLNVVLAELGSLRIGNDAPNALLCVMKLVNSMLVQN